MASKAMEKTKKKKRLAISEAQGLLDVVFSWSLHDMLNKDLYKGQVGGIPKTFTSATSYFKSFVPALIEETHEELLSSMKTLHQAPAFKIQDIRLSKDFEVPKDLFYDVYLLDTSDIQTDGAPKQLEPRDLIAVTNKKPSGVDDLSIFNEPFLLALVCNVDIDNPCKLSILASKPITIESKRKKETLFGVYLINMMTNSRIWKALHPGKEGGNLNLISRVLQRNSDEEGGCLSCLLEDNDFLDPRHFLDLIHSFDLNSSQNEAILNCLEARKCYHTNTIKLIWGPPGTGKTKTTSVLLLTLLKTRCRTLTCAPTNIAVLEVASRVVKLVSQTSKMDGYGLGDIVLFGNGKRMKIDDRDDLVDVFLSYRVDTLQECLKPFTGWRVNVNSMLHLLEDPKGLYLEYLGKAKPGNNNVEDKDSVSTIKHHGNDHKKKEKWVEKIHEQVVSNSLKDKRKKKQKGDNVKKKEEEVCEAEEREEKQPLSMDEFVEQRFSYLRNILKLHFSRLCLHLPTTLLSSQVAEKMLLTINLLKDVKMSAMVDFKSGDTNGMIKDCVDVLRSILSSFTLQDFGDTLDIKNLCLGNACLLFCTASGSTKLYTEEPIQLLVIDEAAQLKECESAIPLQLPRLRHAILIGDEQQLPAMIQSKIASKAQLGRSLFERLVLVGQKKHLLNTQYRMHHAISIFPNKEFYDMKILDAPLVKTRKYTKHFLPGKMFKPYSFINVSYGTEQFGEGYSLKNNVEVAVVSEIIAKLFKVSTKRRKRISVGVISPYKAQVFAIQEKIGGMYSTDTEGLFSLDIRSVDGFQGGEEDIIIISTVRSNIKGTIGFLSDLHRTNVALTRARFCLWILGNEETLTKSKSVWTKLINDAKERNCFHDARDDNSLVQTMAKATIEFDQFHKLKKKKILLFNSSKWKVCFSSEFSKSLEAIDDSKIYSKIMNLLVELSHGRFQYQLEREDVISCFKMLKQDKINDVLSLIWAVDIVKDGLYYVQVLKIWHLLSSSDDVPPTVIEGLDKYYTKYSKAKILQCTIRSTEGNLILPMRWPVGNKDVCSEDVELSGITGSFASLNLMPQTLSKGLRNTKKKGAHISSQPSSSSHSINN